VKKKGAQTARNYPCPEWNDQKGPGVRPNGKGKGRGSWVPQTENRGETPYLTFFMEARKEKREASKKKTKKNSTRGGEVKRDT